MKLTLIHKPLIGVLVALVAVLGLSLGTGDASARVDSGSYVMVTRGFAGTVDRGSAVVRGDRITINGHPYRLVQTRGGGYAELSGIPGYSRLVLHRSGHGYRGEMQLLGARLGTVTFTKR